MRPRRTSRRRWILSRRPPRRPSQRQFSEANPEEFLRFLRVAGDARKVGMDTIDGTQTTRWQATVDLRRYPETVAPQEREAAERTVRGLTAAEGVVMPTTVWIDERGLIRRERLRFEMTVEGDSVRALMVLDFLDVGRPQEVELPEGDDVRDVTDLAVDKLAG
jgi:hypothetical protein